MMGQVVIDTTIAIGIATSIVLAVVSAVALLFKLLIASYEARMTSYEAQITTITAERDNWKQGMREAVGNLRLEANKKRLRHGQAPYEELADVVPEHSSPPTAAEKETAELQTVRAALVAATKDLDLPSRGLDIASTAASVADGAKEVADRLAVVKDKEAKEVAERLISAAKDKEMEDESKSIPVKEPK